MGRLREARSARGWDSYFAKCSLFSFNVNEQVDLTRCEPVNTIMSTPCRKECGIQLGEVTYAHTCEAVIDANNHWITVFMRAEVPSDTLAVNKEPDKCEGWDWYDWKEVPGPRFLPLQKILDDKTYHAVYGEVPPPHLIAGVMMTGGLCVGLCLGIFSTLGISTLLRRR